MWHLLRSLPRDAALSGADTNEFLQQISYTITRSLTLILLTVFLLWGYIAGAMQPAVYLSAVMGLTLLAAVAAGLVLRLMENHPLAAQAVFQLGVMAAVSLGLYLFGQREIALLLMLLPLAAAVTVGWPAAALSGLGVIGLVLLLGRFPEVFALTARDQWVISLGALVAALVGAVTAGALLGVARRAHQEVRLARAQIEETRQQRVDLLQTQGDLLQANRELSRLTERLKAMTQIAEDARRTKEEFVANVSHELRTPLNMIIGFSELIARAPGIYGSLPPALLADIAAIQRNGQHLAELVNDVLDLSQVDAGRMTLVRDWTTLQELVEAAVEAIKVLFDTKGLYLRAELPAEPVRIFCDRTRIREVLLNLLSNAGRFTESGGVTVSAEMHEGRLVVHVTDTGPGIAPEDQKRLFEPFQQLDNSIRREGGSGLGLSISKRFVEMHDGKMWLESQPGAGTTFSFSLPLPIQQPAAPASGASRWITPYTQPEREFRRSRAPAPVVLPRYVLLDQGSALRRMFSRHMREAEILCEETLEAALETLGRSPCQGFIINEATTGITAEALRAAGSVAFTTPVITCWVAGNDPLTRGLGVVDYLLKPVSRERLLGALSALGAGIRTVLVVDDNLEVLQLFGRILQSAEQGYVVLRARDGTQALEILRERRPDVMLVDMVMPGMNGFQVIQQKSADPAIREIPVIVVTSKDPTGAPIVSEKLSVARKGGLSTREMMRCVQAISEILNPETQGSSGRARKESAAE